MRDKWNLFATTMIVVLNLITYSYSFGENCPAPCIPYCSEPCFRDDFNITVDFLWWKPCANNVDYAAVVSSTGSHFNVDYKDICVDWSPGARVIFGRPCFFKDWGFTTSYIYLRAKNHDSLAGQHQITSPLFNEGLLGETLFDKARATYDLWFQEWDVLVTYDMKWNHYSLFRPFFGLGGIYLQQQLEVELQSPGTSFGAGSQSKYWGIGWRIGAEYEQALSERLHFYSIFHGSLLVGTAKNEQRNTDKFHDDRCCLVVPGYHIGVGFKYDASMCDVNFTLRVGYEFENWHNVPNNRVYKRINTFEDISHSTSADTRDVGFHGLIAGASMTF